MTKHREWTPEEVSTLRDLWDKNIVAREIGAMLGGRSKNSVVGKADKLGLPPRDATKFQRTYSSNKTTLLAQPRRFTGKVVVQKVTQHVLVVKEISARTLYQRDYHRRNFESEQLPGPGEKPLVPFLDLQPHECKWPRGDPQKAGFGFCGQPRVEKRPYCAYHVQQAIESPEEKKERLAEVKRRREIAKQDKLKYKEALSKR